MENEEVNDNTQKRRESGKEEKELNENIKKLNSVFENIDYISGNKRKFIVRNFMAGIFRGMGIGIGVTIVTAIVVIFLQRIVTLNIPIIGDFVADIISILETKKY